MEWFKMVLRSEKMNLAQSMEWFKMVLRSKNNELGPISPTQIKSPFEACLLCGIA
jgi:hypothetical protein